MRLIVRLFLVLALSLPVAAMAQISLDEAVQRIKSQSNVRVLSAERVSQDGKTVYRIKVLTGDGRVKYVWVDPGG